VNEQPVSEKRRYNMSQIRGKNSRPELLIRQGLHSRGYRYRLHDSTLPGTPDLVLPRYKTVILIQGCFWHAHGCYLFKWPATRKDFWEQKLRKNRERDFLSRDMLKQAGWRVIEIWECALKGRLKQELTDVLDAVESVLSSHINWVAIEAKPEKDQYKEIKK